MAALRPHLPAVLLALFAFWSGTLPGAASFPAGAAGQGLVLVFALLAAPTWRDPWRLGGAARFLPWALVVAVAASLLASPVPRAGRIALALLPAFLLLPAAFARSWPDRRSRERGALSLSLVVLGVALFALVDRYRAGIDRAAMPLGHHNLLAAFLVILLPVVALGLRSVGARRWCSLATISISLAALAATRSFLAAAALAVVALIFSARRARARQLLTGLALLTLAFLVPRAESMLRGVDSSSRARSVYWRAAWEGFRERPVTGWGPGSTPWTLAETAHPLPGISPAGEIVGQSHSLPLELLRELGLPGFLLLVALLALFLWRRWRERAIAVDRAWTVAGTASLLVAVGCSLGEAWLAVPALPVACAIGMAVALAGGDSRPEERKAISRWPVWIYLLLAAGALVPAALANFSYERAIGSDGRASAASFLERALHLDPDFALYRARWAWISEAPIEERAENAFAAAVASRGVAALWLRAGALSLESGDGNRARTAYSRALALDPLSAFAPFQLAAIGEDPVNCAARAILAEPRLAAATLFRGHEEWRQATLAKVEAWPGVDAGWRAELVRAARTVPITGGDEVELAAKIDREPALSMSLYSFRRRSWPADVARIRVAREGVVAVRALPSAASLANSARAAFPADRCAPAG